MFFVFKQKTTYEMRISDWSSDVCSSDLSKLTVSQVEIPLYVLGKNAGQSAIKKTGKHDKDEQDHYPHLRMTRWQLVLHELSFSKKSNSSRNRIVLLAPDELVSQRSLSDRKSTRLNSSH